MWQPGACDPNVAAASESEPIQPEGLADAALRSFVLAELGEAAGLDWWGWYVVRWPGWAAEGWKRLDAARTACEAEAAAEAPG